MNIEIANRLVQLRKKNNLSQEDLASRIGISRQAVSKWERAEASPDTDNLISLSKIYNVSLDDLLKTEDEPYAYEYVIEENMSNGPKQEDKQRTEELEMEKNEEHANGYRIIEDETRRHRRYPSQGRKGQAGDLFYKSRFGFSKKQLHMFPYPIFVTIVYLVLGSVFGLWHPAWILYLTIPLYYPIVSCIEEDGTLHINKKTLHRFPYPVFITMIYLLIGSLFDLWHPGWILFITIPIYYRMIQAIEE